MIAGVDRPVVRPGFLLTARPTMNEYFGNQVLDGEWHARLPRYLLLADRIREQRVLDLGCSSGIGASLLVELGAERVDAVDPRPESLDLARIKHDKAELDFHRMAWEELEFPDGTFDCVVSLDPSNPVTAPVVLDEIDRVLAPEGEYVCAIERRTVHGMESLLPREDATRVEVGTGNSTPGEKTPQIGQLQRRFGSVVRTRQTPTYGYTFDAVEGDQTTSPPAETDEPNDASSEAEPGNGHEGPTAAEPEETIERSLGSSDESSGVEIIFCGDDVDAPVPHRIDLPYYALVDRIRNHLEHTRNKPVRGSRGPQTPADRRPNEPELDERLALVAETYRAVRRQLAQLRQQLGASLDRQEKSLVQLSDRVGRQVGSPSTGPGRSQGASAAESEGAFGGEEPSTSVYASEDTAVQWTPESSNSDETRTEREHSEVDETSSTRLARLERQQRELRGELEERKAYIDELEERLDADDSSDATDGADSSEASSEVETEHAPNADEPES